MESSGRSYMQPWANDSRCCGVVAVAGTTLRDEFPPHFSAGKVNGKDNTGPIYGIDGAVGDDWSGVEAVRACDGMKESGLLWNTDAGGVP
jgi:hypothetical protein